MTTPRIEEMVEEFRSVSQRKVGEGFIGDMPYTDYEYYYTEEHIDWFRTALTEAHQAGIDEAVEEARAREKQLRDIHTVELDTVSCMSLEQFVVWSDQRKQPKNDTIKALQDNK